MQVRRAGHASLALSGLAVMRSVQLERTAVCIAYDRQALCRELLLQQSHVSLKGALRHFMYMHESQGTYRRKREVGRKGGRDIENSLCYTCLQVLSCHVAGQCALESQELLH